MLEKLKGRVESLLVPLSIAALPVFVLIGISHSIWLDESNSIAIAGHSLSGIVERLRMENNLPAYYLILRGWITLFGDSEPAVRLLSGLFYLGAIAAVYVAARGLKDAPAQFSFYAAFFYMISSQAIHQAQNGRMYSMLGLLSALSITFFLRCSASDHDRRRDWVLLILVNAIGAYTHMWYFFLIAAQVGAASLFCSRKRFTWLTTSAALSVTPFLIGWLPVVVDQFNNGATDWMPAFSWIFVPDVFVRFYGGDGVNFLLSVFFYASCLVLLNRTPRVLFSRWLTEAHAPILLTVTGLSIAVPIAVTAIKPIYWPDRYTIIALPALALLLGEALSRFAPRLPLVLFCYVILIAQVATKLNSPLEGADEPSDKRSAQFIMENIPHGDVIAFTSLSRSAIDYYLARSGCLDCFRETSYPVEIDDHPSWRSAKEREALEGEAKRMVEHWKSDGVRSIWLLYGGDPGISHYLREEIERYFVLRQEETLKGRYHDSILHYIADETEQTKESPLLQRPQNGTSR